MNRDPSVTDEQLADYLKLRAEAKGKGKEVAAASESGAHGATGSALGKRKTSGLYGGTDRGLIGIVCKIGAEYLNSYKGHDDTADDGWLHHKIDWIQSGRETDTDIIERVLRELNYRMAQMSTADRYLEMMGIAAPNGQSCCEYDTRRNAKEIDDKKRDSASDDGGLFLLLNAHATMVAQGKPLADDLKVAFNSFLVQVEEYWLQPPAKDPNFPLGSAYYTFWKIFNQQA